MRLNDSGFYQGLSLVQIVRLDLEDQGKANSAGLNLSMINRQTHFPAL